MKQCIYYAVLTFFCYTVFVTKAKAQEILDYSFYYDYCEYIAIDEPILPFSGGCQENGFYNSIPIGFPFPYLGKTYEKLSTSVDGWAILGQDITFGTNRFSRLDLAPNRPIISPLWETLNIEDGSFLYETRGEAPNRIFIAQWKNVELNFNEGAAISFQMRLHENGRVEFHYQKAEDVNARFVSAQIGLAAPELSVFVDLIDTSDNPTLRTERQFGDDNLRSLPANNQVYAFQPRGNAQSFADYQFEAFQRAFEEITFSFSLPPVNYPEVLGNLDEGVYNNLPIGFSFSFEGENYTSFSASTNGWMTLGQPIEAPTPGNLLENGGNRPVIAPLWDNLSLEKGSFSYTTVGNSPHRILIAQWDSVLWWHLEQEPCVSFQVKLYESDGTIEFLYRRLEGAASNNSASIGIAGKETGTGSFQSLGGWIFFPDAYTDVEIRDFNLVPPDSYIYSFYVSSNFLVTNTHDSGPGSLRDAVEQANRFFNKSFIRFNIPEPPPWVISLDSNLNFFETPIVLDGTTQPGWSEDNRIILDGSNIKGSGNKAGRGIQILYDSCEIYGLQLQNFDNFGILTFNALPVDELKIGRVGKGNIIIGSDTAILLQDVIKSTVEANVIGIDPQGNAVQGTKVGIDINSSDQNTILQNTVVACSEAAISLFGSLNTDIRGNYLGITPNDFQVIPNSIGMQLRNGSNRNRIQQNIISGNEQVGIRVESISSQNIITSNYIGIKGESRSPAPNQGNGIELLSGNNQIGGEATQGNIIAFNQGNGVRVSSQQNQIIGNSIYCNELEGISLATGGNENQLPPQVNLALENGVFGITSPNHRVHVYIDDACTGQQGRIFKGSTVADNEGNWQLLVPFAQGNLVTATSTDEKGNTSSFSSAISVTLPPIISSFQPLSGGVGTPITILGENLLQTSEIIFSNNIAANVEVLDDATLRTLVPEGASTGVISIKTPAGTANSGAFFCVLPPKPSNLRIADVLPGAIRLQWENNLNNFTSIRIERSDGNDANFRLIDEVAAGITEYTDRNSLLPDVTYFYRVQAKNDCNFAVEEYSNQIGATVFDIVTHHHSSHEVENISVFPNPAESELYIQSNGIPVLKIKMWNLLGKCVLEQENTAYTNRDVWQLNVTNIPQGMYILSLETIQKKVFHFKVSIEK